MKKKPTQGRSRQTVDALIEATALTIAERGWAGASTNRIAAKAGVSVGSLYQYFDSREDLLASLVERERDRFIQRLDETLPSLLTGDARVALRTVLELAFEHCERDEALFVELARHWDAAGGSQFATALETYVLDALRLFLSHLYDVYEPMDVPTVSFALTNSAILVIIRFFSVRPKGVTKESLLNELTELYARYFESKRRPSARTDAPNS